MFLKDRERLIRGTIRDKVRVHAKEKCSYKTETLRKQNIMYARREQAREGKPPGVNYED